MRYQVLENGKPAILSDSQNNQWHGYEFDTYGKAFDYARDWLGMYYQGQELPSNTPVIYYGGETFDCTIEIRKV